jgi:sialate O-acetylesterase
MIQDWRNAFESGPISFYFVQIAPFGYRNDTGQAALLRDSQRTALALENTGMAVTMDIGNPGNIHPLNKRDVGDRLARWALAKDYGQTDLTYSGPLYKSAEVEDGRITIHFDHTDGGLVSRGGPLTHFTIAGKDRNFGPAIAQIVGNTIVVSSPDVVEPVAVRFGWGAADEPNLFNGGGLPASSFRTDDWE